MPTPVFHNALSGYTKASRFRYTEVVPDTSIRPKPKESEIMDCSRRPRMAYIDGGMVAFIFQGAVGALLAGLLYVKIYWRNIKAWFSGDHAKAAATEPGKEDTVAPQDIKD